MAITTRERPPEELVRIGAELAEVGGFMLLGNEVARQTPDLLGLKPPVNVINQHSLDVLGIANNFRALQGIIGPSLSLGLTLAGLGMICRRL